MLPNLRYKMGVVHARTLRHWPVIDQERLLKYMPINMVKAITTDYSQTGTAKEGRYDGRKVQGKVFTPV